MKIKLSTFIVLIFTAFFVGTAKAEVNKLDVTEDISIGESSSDITYSLNIQNKSSTELISKVEFFVPYSNYSLLNVSGAKNYSIKEDTILVDLFKQPINVRSSKFITITIRVNNLVDKWGDYNRVGVKRLTSDYEISSFNLKIKYPENWGYLSYSSIDTANNANILSYNENVDLYLVWGSHAYLSYTYDVQLKSNKSSLIPLPRDNNLQSTFIRSFEGVVDVYFDKDNNTYALAPANSSIIFKGGVDLNSRRKNKTIDSSLTRTEEKGFMQLTANSNEDKIKEIIKNYKAENKPVTWDRYVKFVQWSRSVNVPAYLNIGWNLGLNHTTSTYVYWISWYDGVNWNELDLSELMLGKTNNYKQINPERIVLLEVVKLDGESYERIANLANDNIRPSFNTSTKSIEANGINLNVFFDKDNRNLNKINGKANIDNTSDKFVNLKSFKVNDKSVEIINRQGDLNLGILPNKYKVFDFNYYMKAGDVLKDPLELSYSVDYILGGESITYTGKDSMINWESSLNLIHLVFVLLVTGVVFFGWTSWIIIQKELGLFRNFRIFGKL